jgi:hypothetical protein
MGQTNVNNYDRFVVVAHPQCDLTGSTDYGIVLLPGNSTPHV